MISIEVHPGAFLVRGTPLGSVWSSGPGLLSGEAAERIAARVAECIHVDFERTSAQDVGYGLRQLTDVVNKALSPGIDDPTPAIHALGHISAFLCALSDHDLGAELLRDDDDRVRVVMYRPDLASYAALGLSQPRRYGAADPQVLQKIFQILLDLSYRVAPGQRSVVRNELERLRATAAAQPFDPTERAGLDAMDRQIQQKLEGSPLTGWQGRRQSIVGPPSITELRLPFVATLRVPLVSTTTADTISRPGPGAADCLTQAPRDRRHERIKRQSRRSAA